MSPSKGASPHKRYTMEYSGEITAAEYDKHVGWRMSW